MKRLLTLLGIICILSSCIYESRDDKFYRTLWVSEEAPFCELGKADLHYKTGNVPALTPGRLTIEFLCGSNISVSATGTTTSYGTYRSSGSSAHFAELSLTFHGKGAETIASYLLTEEDESELPDNAPPLTIVIEEAHRSGDQLHVTWHLDGSPTSYSTRFVRRSSYE